MPAVVRSRIPQIIATLQPKVRKAMREGAETIAEDARDRAPVGSSGRLRESIHVEDAEEGVMVLAGDDDVFYGHLVEFGTTHSAPRPFMLPAAEAHWEDVQQAIEDALEDL